MWWLHISYLTCLSVLVQADVTNVALRKPTQQSSTLYPKERAVDGNTNSDLSKGSCSVTKNQQNPWWMVDLGREYMIDRILITSRGDCDVCVKRIQGFEIRIGNSNLKGGSQNSVCQSHQTIGKGKTKTIICNTFPIGRYVTVRLPNKKTHLTLCEVQVFEPDTNVALSKSTQQSSTLYPKERAVDGNTNSDLSKGSCSVTKNQQNPWWMVDLGREYMIDRILITSRGDCDVCVERIQGFEVHIGNSNLKGGSQNSVCQSHQNIGKGETKTIRCKTFLTGRYLTISLSNKKTHLTLCEVQVFGKPGCSIASTDSKPTVSVKAPWPKKQVYHLPSFTKKKGDIEFLGRAVFMSDVYDILHRLHYLPKTVIKPNEKYRIKIRADTFYCEKQYQIPGLLEFKLIARNVLAKKGCFLDLRHNIPMISKFTKPKAANGGTGAHGANGIDGTDGIQGTNVFIVYLTGQGKMKIVSSGANGSPGQNGGDGGNGWNGRNGKDYQRMSGNCIYWKTKNHCYARAEGYYYNNRWGWATNGGRGGNGGYAGKPGNGGNAGGIKIYSVKSTKSLSLEISSCPGQKARKAKLGSPGKGGRGGKGGTWFTCHKHWHTKYWAPNGGWYYCKKKTGRLGNGARGSSGSVPVDRYNAHDGRVSASHNYDLKAGEFFDSELLELMITEANDKYLQNKKVEAKKVYDEIKFVGAHIKESKEYCRRIRKGSDYRGKIAQTKSGFKCQPWKKQSPHSHSYTPEKYPNAGLDSNFCRNPDGSAQGPWCYTTSPKKIREYCAVPFCRYIDECPSGSHTCHSQASCTNIPGSYYCACQPGYRGDGASCKGFGECKITKKGFEYRGDVFKTKFGRTCQAWASQTPHKQSNTPSKHPSAGLNGNKCRNPNGKPDGPWCYTVDKKKTWEYCQVNLCPIIKSYRGVITSPGYPYAYPKDKGQRLRIIVPDQFSGINLKFYRLDLTASKDCKMGDFLKIYEITNDGLMVTKFFSCPIRQTLPSFLVSGRSFVLEFNTDPKFKTKKTGHGFKILYEASLVGHGERCVDHGTSCKDLVLKNRHLCNSKIYARGCCRSCKDYGLPIFCTCFINSALQRASVVKSCFSNDPLKIYEIQGSSIYKPCPNAIKQSDVTCTDDSLFRMKERYVSDLNNVEKLNLNKGCKAKEVISYMWMEHHPKLNRRANGIFQKSCTGYRTQKPPDFLKEVLDWFMGLSTSALRSCTLENVIKLLSPANVPGLYQETLTECTENSVDSACYMTKLRRIVTALEEIRKAEHPPHSTMFNNLIKLSIYLTFTQRPSDKTRFKFGSKYDAQKGFLDSITLLADVVHSLNIKKIKLFQLCIPDQKDLQTIEGCHKSSASRKCMVKTSFEQVYVYLETRYSSSAKSQIIQSGIDHAKRLKELRDATTFDLIQAQSFNMIKLFEHLKKDLKIIIGKSTGQIKQFVAKGFSGLGQYFSTVARFDSSKSKADISFITTKLKNYKRDVNTLQTKVGGKLDDILNWAIGIATGDVVEKVVLVGFAVAGACNPLKHLTGDSHVTVMEIMDRAANLAQAADNLAQAIKLKTAINDLVEKTKRNARKLKKNEEFLKGVHALIKKIEDSSTSTRDFEKLKVDFLKKYNGYTPALSKPEINEMASYWEAVVSGGCDVINNAGGAVANALKAKVRADGTCWKTPIAIKKMIATFEEIFDFQFQLMGSLAAYVRAMTSKNAADKILKNFGDIAKQTIQKKKWNSQLMGKLKFTTMYSFVMYNFQQWSIIEDYCNFLEYTEGGIRPGECQGIKTSLRQLLGRSKRECLRKISSVIDIPIMSQGPKKTIYSTAYLNLAALLAGKKTVSFQIPSSKWLIEKQIIGKHDRESAIYLESVKLFPPISSISPTRITVHTDFGGENRLTPNSGVNYLILPKNGFTFEYKEGGYIACSRKRENIYNICPSKKLHDICILAESQKPNRWKALPSIYAKWDIRVHGYEKIKVPKHTTDLFVRAELEFCTIKKKGGMRKDVDEEEDEANRMCCAGQKYYSWKSRSCKPCPTGSTPRLNGYFCAKD